MRRTACGIAALALLLGALPLHAQTSGPAIKDESAAVSYAMKCPGCGQLYTGELAKGAALAVVGIGSLVAAPFLLLNGDDQADEMAACEDDFFSRECAGLDADKVFDTNWGAFAGALAVSAAAYVYGIIDAPGSARRMNARNGFRVGSNFEIAPTAGIRRSGAAALGMRVSTAR